MATVTRYRAFKIWEGPKRVHRNLFSSNQRTVNRLRSWFPLGLKEFNCVENLGFGRFLVPVRKSAVFDEPSFTLFEGRMGFTIKTGWFTLFQLTLHYHSLFRSSSFSLFEGWTLFSRDSFTLQKGWMKVRQIQVSQK